MDYSRAEEVLRRIEESAYRRYLPIVGRRRGRILSESVREHNPRRILEVGTLVGYSAILMGKELGEGSEIIGIEFDEDEAEQARINISDAMLEPSVEILKPVLPKSRYCIFPALLLVHGRARRCVP